MTVALLLISDGRDEYLQATVESAAKHLPDFDQHIHIDDRDHALGFAGAIRAGWEQVDTDHVFHLEADFVFHDTIPVDRMIAVLDREPRLAQLVLKRQPWNPLERAAGGIVEQHPDDYTEIRDGQDVWTEHRRFFSTNPCVYPTRICRHGWPQEEFSEGKFTHKLIREPLLRFAFWGSKHAPPLCEHIGHIRAGAGY